MIKIKQLHFSEVIERSFDYFIVSSGYESRSVYQASKFSGTANKKIAFGFTKENDNSIRIANDEFFRASGFEMFILDGEESSSKIIHDIVVDIISLSKNKGVANVYIDYSCMTKNWYAYFLYTIKYLISTSKVNIVCGYSHGTFIPFDGKETLNRVVAPLFGYCSLSIPNKPTALIIGIGNEPNRISGLKEYFDAKQFLFYTDSSYNPEFSKEIEINCDGIIEETNLENIFSYPIHDLIYSYLLLENLCTVLLKDYRVIIAPCGPKPFSLLSMIVSLKFDNLIEVWRISPGHNLSKIDRNPSGLITTIEIIIS